MRIIRTPTLFSALALFVIGTQLCVANALAKHDRDAMMRAIVEGWRESREVDGFLPYGFDFLSGQRTDDPTSSGYILRQAGTFWGWIRYYRYSADPRDREPTRDALALLGQHSLPIGKSRLQAWFEATRILSVPAGRLTLTSALQRLGLLYDPVGPGKVVSADGQYATAWSGATALALLTELAYRQATGDDGFAALRAAWRDGLLALRIPGGGFRESPASIEDSDYFNGEAWLALAVYADVFRDDEAVSRVLDDLDHHLMERYARKPSSTFFQWGAMAAAQRWRTTHDARFVEYLKHQADVFTQRFSRQIEEHDNACAPMEGLAVMQGVFMESGEERSDLAVRVAGLLDREAAKLPKFQLQRGQTQMTFGGGATLVAPRLADFPGAFLFDAHRPVTRVDAALHCLSALMLMNDNEQRAWDHVRGTPTKQ
jgi:hypothetical protein